MQVLIVMADQGAATDLSRRLGQQGFACQIAEGGFYALTMLERYQPDAVVCSGDVVDMSGFDLYDIVRSDASLNAIRFILLDQNHALDGDDTTLPSDASTEAVVQALRAESSDVPAQPSSFHERVASASHGNQVNGTLEVLTLFDLVTSLIQNGRSGTLSLLIKGSEGSISLHEGKVVHALFGELTGEKALKQIFFQTESHDDTEFLFESRPAGEPAGEVTIRRSAQELLLHVAVELDNLRNDAVESR